MFWVVFAFLVAAEAAKLDNTYLPPPPSAKDAGGSDGALEVPLEPPYVDQYSNNNQLPSSYGKSLDHQRHPVSSGQPGNRRVASKPNTKILENEDEIVVPTPEKGRFISGSYSYTGPDNVLVTVTYKANDRHGRKEVENEENSSIEEDESVEEEQEQDARALEEEEESEEDLVIPTPSSLPAELARAFDIHRNKHQAQEPKPKHIKKPIRKTHKKKGPHAENEEREGQYGMKIGGPQSGYQYSSAGAANAPPVPIYGAPTIHQGYSYPKQS